MFMYNLLVVSLFRKRPELTVRTAWIERIVCIERLALIKKNKKIKSTQCQASKFFKN